MEHMNYGANEQRFVCFPGTDLLIVEASYLAPWANYFFNAEDFNIFLEITKLLGQNFGKKPSRGEKKPSRG